MVLCIFTAEVVLHIFSFSTVFQHTLQLHFQISLDQMYCLTLPIAVIRLFLLCFLKQLTIDHFLYLFQHNILQRKRPRRPFLFLNDQKLTCVKRQFL